MDAMVNKWKTGRRRVLDLVPSRPARWPARAAQRRELLEAWRYVAAQMLRRNRVNLRLLPALVALTEWTATDEERRDGVVMAGNDLLAQRSRCSARTVARLLDHYVALGLLTRDTVNERREDGVMRPTRTLRHAFPENGLDGITLPDDEAEPVDLPESADTRRNAPDNVQGGDDWLNSAWLTSLRVNYG